MSVSPVKSAIRVLEVLDYFQRKRSPHQLKEICAALGYPLSSGTVLLKNLAALGYLNYDRTTRCYFPTLRVVALGDWISQALLGQGQILDVMRELHGATGETISIAVQNDVYLQYIRVIQSTHALRFHTVEGSLRPLTLSAAGWLLMSAHAGKEVERLIRRANIATARKEDRQPAEQTMRRVNEARSVGAAYTEHIPLPGGASVCVMLPVTMQERPVVLGLGGAVDRIRANRDRYLRHMHDLADTLRA